MRIQAITALAMRGAAVFLALFTLIGIIGELRGRTSDVSLWWIDLRDIPTAIRVALLAIFAGLLGAWAILPAPGLRLRSAAAASSVVFTVLAVRDAVRFYAAVAAGGVRPAVGVPLSLFIAVLLGGLAVAILRARRHDAAWRWRGRIGLLVAAATWAVVFPLAQMLFFGTTDYRRPADVAVVFGARVYANGEPSPLLADRIRTSVALYESGLVPLLVMSGGDGTDGFNEAEVMRSVAIASGVDPAAVVADPAGRSTEATVANVMSILDSRNGSAVPGRIIAVSQAYHLPRIQLAFANAGIDVLTVPASEREPISEMPLQIGRAHV